MPDAENRQYRYTRKILVETLAVQANNSKLLVSHESELHRRSGNHCSCALPIDPGSGDRFYLSADQLGRRDRCSFT